VSATDAAAESARSLRSRTTFDGANESGYESTLPPVRVADYRTLVRKLTPTATTSTAYNSLSLLVPLGTYTGWNTRAAGFGEGTPAISSAVSFRSRKRPLTPPRRETRASRSRAAIPQLNPMTTRSTLRRARSSRKASCSQTMRRRNGQVKTQAHNSASCPVRLALGRDRDGRRRDYGLRRAPSPPR